MIPTRELAQIADSYAMMPGLLELAPEDLSKLVQGRLDIAFLSQTLAMKLVVAANRYLDFSVRMRENSDGSGE